VTDNTISALDANFAEFPMLVAGPPSEADFAALEAAAPFALPADYITFVKRYGGAIVGPYSVFGIGASDAMGKDDSSVTRVTDRFRAQRWPGTESTLVISMDHAGNPITMNAAGHVHLFDHDCGDTHRLGDSFEDFIHWCLQA